MADEKPWDKFEDWRKEDPMCSTPDDLPIRPGKAVPWPTADDDPEYTAQYRIEALRAASRIMAGVASAHPVIPPELDAASILLAERFARWLETGKR